MVFLASYLQYSKGHRESKNYSFLLKKPTSLCGVGFFYASPKSISQPLQGAGVFAPVFLKTHRQIQINFFSEQRFQLKPGGAQKP